MQKGQLQFKGRKRHLSFFLIAFACLLSACLGSETASAYRIDDVPAYKWYHGCGPTAAASILGYYDINGYDNLFGASDWSRIRKTKNVADHISSPEHNAKYDPSPDVQELPEVTDTSIADFFHTSEGSLRFGWSYITHADNAFSGYAALRGYAFDAVTYAFQDLTWSYLVSEIDTGRPMLFMVDADGDGRNDHFVPVLGYRNRGNNGQWYGLYTTWTETEKIVWKLFRPSSSAYRWGVGYATAVQPAGVKAAAVPEPSALLYSLVGLSCMVATTATFKRKQKKGEGS